MGSPSAHGRFLFLESAFDAGEDGLVSPSSPRGLDAEEGIEEGIMGSVSATVSAAASDVEGGITGWTALVRMEGIIVLGLSTGSVGDLYSSSSSIGTACITWWNRLCKLGELADSIGGMLSGNWAGWKASGVLGIVQSVGDANQHAEFALRLMKTIMDLVAEFLDHRDQCFASVRVSLGARFRQRWARPRYAHPLRSRSPSCPW